MTPSPPSYTCFCPAAPLTWGLGTRLQGWFRRVIFFLFKNLINNFFVFQILKNTLPKRHVGHQAVAGFPLDDAAFDDG